MIKVFLVEDEFIVREGIKSRIQWEKNGLVFCGEASDGELAFPMIKKEQPDIVITDIRMPFMDGLELSRLIKKEMPQIKIIILSGHEEFEYAKSAIGIGVEEYLLKPISSEELLQVVNHVAEKIREEKTHADSLQNFQRESRENLEIAKRELFNDLISKETALTEIIERGSALHLELMAACYNLILVKLQRTGTEHSFSNRVIEIQEKLTAYEESQKDRLICFDRAPEGKAILVLGGDEKQAEENICRYIENFQKIVSQYSDISYFGSVGKLVYRLRELSACYETASHGFAYRFLMDANQFIYAESCLDADVKNDTQENCQIGAVATANLDKHKIEAFLKGGEVDEIGIFVEQYIRNTGEAGENSLLFRQYIVMDMYFAALHFLGQIDQSEELQLKEPFETPEQMNRILATLDSAIGYVAELFDKVMRLRDRQTVEHNSDIVDTARQYILDNYTDEELTLNRVASHVNVSPNHLSAIFSQKTGQTFVKYLTDVRMSRAKELLKCTNMRSNEISEAIGYKDPHYFSYIFKKNNGCTPMQYRERGGSP